MGLYGFAKNVYRSIRHVLHVPLRNRKTLHQDASLYPLEWVDNGNLGDALGPVIFQWMLKTKGLEGKSVKSRNRHLLTVGSLIGLESFDAVVWGSGIHMLYNVINLNEYAWIRKYDLRAVRGPLTREILLYFGYACPEVYGDPAVIMPLIYDPEIPDAAKEYDVSVILHYHLQNKSAFYQDELHYINMHTSDYKAVIEQIKQSKKVISSSLHGIILSETYGVPAVFLNTGEYVGQALLKYYDWYYSTGRYSVKMAFSLQEAVAMEPMALPELHEMRERIMDAFPCDLWE